MTDNEIAKLLDAHCTGTRRWMARCPGHDDREPSLSISEGRGPGSHSLLDQMPCRGCCEGCWVPHSRSTQSVARSRVTPAKARHTVLDRPCATEESELRP